jgi:hypothetical protein
MMQTQNDRFTASRSNKSGGEREKAIQRLMVAGAAFAELEQSFAAGIKFHESFEVTAVAVQSRVRAVCQRT